jgi:hypothetical protein
VTVSPSVFASSTVMGEVQFSVSCCSDRVIGLSPDSESSRRSGKCGYRSIRISRTGMPAMVRSTGTGSAALRGSSTIVSSIFTPKPASHSSSPDDCRVAVSPPARVTSKGEVSSTTGPPRIRNWSMAKRWPSERARGAATSSRSTSSGTRPSARSVWRTRTFWPSTSSSRL